MSDYLHPAHVANVVTSFALLWSGLIITFFWFIEATQPLRWLFFYISIIITAIPTIVHHIIPLDEAWTALDITSNILVVFSLQLALAGDYFSRRIFKIFSIVSGVVNLILVVYLLCLLFLPVPNVYFSLGEGKGFTLGEFALILNAVVAVMILGSSYRKLTFRERVVLLVILGTFLLGLSLATGSDEYIFPKYIGWHSMWHLTGSFGFILFWYFNHLRFVNKGKEK